MAFVVISHWRSICSFFSDDTCCAVLTHHLRPRKRPVQMYSVICRRSPLGLLRFLNRYGNNRSLAENVACWDNTPNTPAALHNLGYQDFLHGKEHVEDGLAVNSRYLCELFDKETDLVLNLWIRVILTTSAMWFPTLVVASLNLQVAADPSVNNNPLYD